MHSLWRITPNWKICIKHRKDMGNKKPPFNSCNPDNDHTERNDQEQNMCFRCGPEDHFIDFFLNLDTSENKFHWNTEKHKTCAYRPTKIDKTLEKSKGTTYDIRVYGRYIIKFRNS